MQPLATRRAQRHRVPLLAAIAFVALLTLGYSWVPAPPDLSAPGLDVVDWARSHDSAITVQAWLVTLAWLPGAALLALVGRRLEGAVMFAYLLGGAIIVTLLLVGILLRLGLAAHAVDLDPGTARALADVEAYWGPISTIGVVLQAAALAIATRDGAFPGWLLPISAFLAVWQTVETVTILGTDGFAGPGGGMNLLGALFYGVWLVAQGVAASRPAAAAAA